eukprot:923998-Alexandrium_andersonii.AAC.1
MKGGCVQSPFRNTDATTIDNPKHALRVLSAGRTRTHTCASNVERTQTHALAPTGLSGCPRALGRAAADSPRRSTLDEFSEGSSDGQ